MFAQFSKKYIAIIAVVLGGFLLVGALVWGLSPAPTEQAGPTPRPTLPPEPVNVIPVEERPYARITPTVDGRTLKLSLEAINKPADEAEYEIEYQTGTVLQGAGGLFSLSALPSTQDVLLGSCSAGGKCSYHEGVTGGQLTFRMSGDSRYAVRGEWSLWSNPSGAESTLSSRDGKFGLSGTGLTRVRYGVVFLSPGYPAELPGEALSSMYAIGVSSVPTGSTEVSLRLNSDVASADIAVWDGTAWKTVSGTVADKTVTASLATVPQAVIAVTAE